MSKTRFSRRHFLASATVTTGAVLLPLPALAFSTVDAEKLITKTVAEITKIINSGKSEAAMYRDFEGVLNKYADTSSIARSVLGPTARSASKSELNAFTKAFKTYLSRKYGSRFRQFIGGKIVVNKTQKVNKIFDVRCTSILQGEAPFEISFIVHSAAGKFIDLQIEGISLLKSERAEIGAMLDQAGGSISKLTANLR